MKPISILAVWVVLCMAVSVKAQTKFNRNSFKDVDKYVADLGPMDGNFLKYIVDTLTHRGTAPQANQVRAMYMWEARHIRYNTAARRHPKQANHSASAALNERSASHEGYANLFKAMCDLARIRCEVIPGMAKFDPRDIGKLSPKWNRHTWNAVQVDGTWYLVDVAWGAGYTDRKFRFFTPAFTDAWFFTDRDLFAMSHYPDKKNWQLLDSPINKSAFTYAPIIGKSAIINEIYPEALRGNVKGKADTTKNMVFEIGNPELIKSMAVTHRTNKKVPVKYTIEGDRLYADIPFTSTGDYAFDIYVNDELAYTYQAAIGKAKKKPAPKKPASKKEEAKKANALKKQAEAKQAAAAKAEIRKTKALEAKQEAIDKKAREKEKAEMKKAEAKQAAEDKKAREKEKAEKAKQDAEEKKQKEKEKAERAKQEAEEKKARDEERAREKAEKKKEKEKKDN